MALGTQIDDGLATSILATGTTPDTAEEWIIAAINYIHNSSLTPEDLTPYVLRDGTRSFTASETFENGMVISGGQVNATAGLTINSSGGTFAVISETGQTVIFHSVSPMTWGDALGLGNGCKLAIDDTTSTVSLVVAGNNATCSIGEVGGSQLVLDNSSGEVIWTWTTDHLVLGVGDYADDSAAATGNVAVGETYFNTSNNNFTKRLS